MFIKILKHEKCCHLNEISSLSVVILTVSGSASDRNFVKSTFSFQWYCLKPMQSSLLLTKSGKVQYIPRNMHTGFALLCFVVVIHWLNYPYPSGLLHWHCGNLTIAPVSAKQPWWIWINTSCEFIMNDCITTTKQSTTKPCAYFLGYTVHPRVGWNKQVRFILNSSSAMIW